MLATEIRSMAQSRVRTLVSVVLIVLNLGMLAAASNSVASWQVPHHSASFNDIEHMSDLLIARVHTEARALANAKRIISDLSSMPTCSHGPTVRLLRQCKLIKPEHQAPGSARQKENTQATYAITMALCETRQARVTAPSACRSFENMLERQPEDSAIEIVRQDDIELCSNQLFNTASWTSYTAFKAQSKDLCDSSRVDYQREELLEHFRQATNIIPDILDALRDQQFESHIFMTGLRQDATVMVEAQKEMLSASQSHVLATKEQLKQLSEQIQAQIRIVNESGTSWRSVMTDGVKQASVDLDIVGEKANNLEVNLAQLYAAAAEAVSSMSFGFQSDLDLMAGHTSALVERVIDLSSSGHLTNIQSTMEIGQNAATQFATIQSAQVEAAQAQLSVSRDVLDAIESTSGRMREVVQALDMLPTSWFESLRHVQEQIRRFRYEVRYALVFMVLATLLLLFGRPRGALITTLLYVFVRTLWSISQSSQLPISDLLTHAKDLELPNLRLAGAVCLGTLTIFAGRHILPRVYRHRNTVKNVNSQQDSPALFGKLLVEPRREVYQPPTLNQQSSKQIGAGFNRFTRGVSVPLDMP